MTGALTASTAEAHKLQVVLSLEGNSESIIGSIVSHVVSSRTTSNLANVDSFFIRKNRAVFRSVKSLGVHNVSGCILGEANDPKGVAKLDGLSHRRE